MNTKQYVKIAALAIGAMLVLKVVTALSQIYAGSRAMLDRSDLAIGAIPLLLAILLASFIYRYSCSLEFDESGPGGMGLVEAGVKLLGAYWIVSAFPSFLFVIYVVIQHWITPLLTSVPRPLSLTQVIHPATNALVYGLAGFVFIRRTETIKRLMGVSEVP